MEVSKRRLAEQFVGQRRLFDDFTQRVLGLLHHRPVHGSSISGHTRRLILYLGVKVE